MKTGLSSADNRQSDLASLPLKPRQILFADRYLVLNNATKAAIEAGYREKNARHMGAENLAKPHIAQYIAAKVQERQEKERPLQQQILDEIKAMAFFNAEDVSRVDDDGNLLIDFSRAERRHYAAVTSLQTKTKVLTLPGGKEIGREIYAKVGLADKYRGLELLGKHLGMFKEAEQRVTIDISDRLLSARARVQEALPPPVAEDGDVD